ISMTYPNIPKYTRLLRPSSEQQPYSYTYMQPKNNYVFFYSPDPPEQLRTSSSYNHPVHFLLSPHAPVRFFAAPISTFPRPLCSVLRFPAGSFYTTIPRD